jgi:hypothetical protein
MTGTGSGRWMKLLAEKEPVGWFWLGEERRIRGK